MTGEEDSVARTSIGSLLSYLSGGAASRGAESPEDDLLLARFVQGDDLAFTALVGVTLSFVAATAGVSLFGYTFNSLVTLGLLLALGFVVTGAAGATEAIVSRVRADAADEASAGQDRAALVGRAVLAACGELRGALAGAG